MKKSILLITILLCLSAAPVFACTPPVDWFDYTLTDQANAAAVVLVGRVSSQIDHQEEYLIWYEVEIEVETYLKGGGSELLVVDSYENDLWSTCPGVGIPNEGEYLIFFFYLIDGRLVPFRAGHLASIHPVTQAAIDEITAATNTIATPEPLPIDAQATRLARKYQDWILWIALPVGLIAGISLLIRRFTKRRKSKAKREELL